MQLQAMQREDQPASSKIFVLRQAATNWFIHHADMILAQASQPCGKAAERKLVRSETLIKTNAATQQTLHDDRGRRQRRNGGTAAEAQLAASDAAINAVKAAVVDADASVEAAQATIQSIKADLKRQHPARAARSACAISRPPAGRSPGRGRRV
jgi:HlyD family secretion protein